MLTLALDDSSRVVKPSKPRCEKICTACWRMRSLATSPLGVEVLAMRAKTYLRPMVEARRCVLADALLWSHCALRLCPDCGQPRAVDNWRRERRSLPKRSREKNVSPVVPAVL